MPSGLVFLGEDEKILASRKLSSQSSSEYLLPLISSLLKKTNLSIQRVDALVITNGPGSFTSLRVGIALAKALSFSLMLPLVAVPTLDLIAFSLPVSGFICALIPAYRSSFFAAFFKKDADELERVGEYLFLSFDEITEQAKKFFPDEIVFVCFSADYLPRERPNSKISFFKKEVKLEKALLKWALRDIRAGRTVDPLILTPIYVSAPIIHKKKT